MSVRMELFLIYRLEHVAFVVRHFVPLEERQVFLAKSLARMVSYLVPDIIYHPSELRVRIRKGTETLLPRKPSRHPPLLVDVVGGARLDVAHQIRQGDIRPQADQDMRVVRHAMDGAELLTLTADDAGHVFL